MKQELMSILDESEDEAGNEPIDVCEAIGQGDEDVQAGRMYDVAEAFAAIRERHGVPR